MNKTIALLLLISSGGLGFYNGSFVFPHYTTGIGEYIAPAEIVEIKQAKKEIVKVTSLSNDREPAPLKTNPSKKELFKFNPGNPPPLHQAESREILKHKLAELTTYRSELIKQHEATVKQVTYEYSKELQKYRDQVLRAEARGYERGRDEVQAKLKK